MTFDDTIGVLSQGEYEYLFINFGSCYCCILFRFHGSEPPFPPGLPNSAAQERFCVRVERPDDHGAGERQQRAVLGPGRRRRPGHRALPHPALRLWHCLRRQRPRLPDVHHLLQPERLDPDQESDHRRGNSRAGAHLG